MGRKLIKAPSELPEEHAIWKDPKTNKYLVAVDAVGGNNYWIRLPIKPIGYSLRCMKEDEYNDLLEEAIDRGFVILTMLACDALNQGYGFGKVRLARFVDELLARYNEFEDIHEDYYKLKDKIKEKYDIRFEVEIGGNK